jgi:hypothetical protein
LHDALLARRIVRAGIENRTYRLEDATMPVKQASKRKRVTKAAIPALGAAGLTFSLAGAASAATMPAADTAAQKLNFSPTQGVLLGEEEIADVSLSTFHLFDKEQGTAGAQQMAWGCRCGGCRGCGGGRGCGGCRGCRGCAGCAGCAACCASVGYCRLC